MTQSPQDTGAFVPASVILRTLRDEAPGDHFSLAWLLGKLPKQSFGLVMLLLAILAVAPGICVPAGLLLLVPAFEMIVGRAGPSFPSWLSDRPLPTRHLDSLVAHAISVLEFLEKAIQPRWGLPHEATKRIVGVAVLILSAKLVLTPIPFSNVIPALIIALISLAYLEEDGLLLVGALVVGSVLIAVDLVMLAEMVRGAKAIGRFW